MNKKKLIQLYRQGLTSGIDLREIDRKVDKMVLRTQVSRQVEKKVIKNKEQQWQRQLPRLVRAGAFILPVTFIGVGVFLLWNALAPISHYYFTTLPQLSVFDLTTPIPRENLLDVAPSLIAYYPSSQILGEESTAEAENQPIVVSNKLDYSNLANWFDNKQTLPTQAKDEYSLKIPKLKIDQALVKIGGINLNESIIQYPGTAEPGRPGAPVLFGHSVLRQFYNPSPNNPRRYNSIFSTIMTLQKGDEIILLKDNVEYKYLVEAKTEVKPEDVYILSQNYDERKLKLVTCVPEGTYLRRGVVTARLVN